MGARPSSFKKGGGGFLNGVDGAIEGYEMHTSVELFGEPEPKKGKEPFNGLYSVLTVMPDGADEEVTTRIFVGNADSFEISEDRKTLTPIEEGFGISANSDWGRFIASMCENGFDENELPEDELNWEAIEGQRVRFEQELDKEKTAKKGKRKDKKTGKEYDWQYLVARVVYGATDAPATPATKKATNGSGKQVPAKPAKGGKANGAADELYTLAKDTLLKILADKKNGGEIAKSAIPVQVSKQLGLKHPQREAVRRLVYSDDFLSKQDGWTYDASSKTQTITAD